MQLKRKDPYLSEAIEILDGRLANAQGDIDLAYSSLTKFELEFVDNEIERCLDFRYYAENYHVVNSKHEGIKTLYPFFESQEIFYDRILKIQKEKRPVKVLCLKARQLGISTLSEALIFHRTAFTEACTSLIVAQDPAQADYLFNMSRTAYDSLPWWMRPEARYEAKGRYLEFDRTDDTERQTNPGLRSSIFVEAANKISGVAVGKALICGHFSEISLWPDAKILAEQIFPTLCGTSQQIAILESTARGRNNFWFDFWEDAWAGRLDWEPIFIEFFRLKKYSKPIPSHLVFERTPDEQAIAAKVEKEKDVVLTDEQLYWRRSMLAEFATLNRGDESKFFQEYPGVTPTEAFQGSGICAFNKKTLQLIIETTCAPPMSYGEITLDQDKNGKWIPVVRLTKLKKGQKPPQQEGVGGRLYVWDEPQEEATYFVSADVAHGLYGGDYSSCQVIKLGHGPHPDEQVAEWHGWINPTPYGDVLAALGYWYNTAQIAIEVNDVGQTTNARVMRVLEYPLLFRWKHYDKIKNFMTDLFGWWTNVKTRDLIIAKFREYIDDRMIVIRSEELIKECLDFSSVDDSRFEGQSTHDDRVFSMMIGVFCAHDSEGWSNESVSNPVRSDPDNLCICGHAKDRHGDGKAKGFCVDCGLIVDPRTGAEHSVCPMWRQKLDFINTDFSEWDNPKRLHRQNPNENEPVPEEVTMYEELQSASDERWKLY